MSEQMNKEEQRNNMLQKSLNNESANKTKQQTDVEDVLKGKTLCGPFQAPTVPRQTIGENFGMKHDKNDDFCFFSIIWFQPVPQTQHKNHRTSISVMIPSR